MESERKLQGLTSGEVLTRRKQYGENRLPEEKPISVPEIVLNQLKSPLIYIILAAAGVSLALGETGDFWIIMVVVLTDVVLGFFQEYKAQRTYVALKGLLHPTATVCRDGERTEVEVWELVPGDLVILSAGDKVPADGILVEAAKITVDESILTGESEPVSRLTAQQLFMGTTTVTGRGTLEVEKTGLQTELGRIASSLSRQEEGDTPFQIRLKSFSRFLTKVVVFATTLILLVGLTMGREFLDMLRTAIILAIAAVPEGLLIAVTVILVLGMRKILKRKGLVKRLLAVETLGSVTVICTDKTGTLTEGRMRVSRTEFTDLENAVRTMVFCNNLEGPLETALWEYARKELGADPQVLADQAVRHSEDMFTSDTKYMVTEVSGELFKGRRFHFLKGAPEIVLAKCSCDERCRKEISDLTDRWADDGLRLLGLAFRENGSGDDGFGYTWAGLVGMEDPIRVDVVDSIRAARNAKIQVKMITGDYRRTAEQIAMSIGLLEGAGTAESTLEGEQIAAMSDGELRDKVTAVSVFARIRPQEKFRIINALQENGEITAMIGDGVNDTPALKRANIGVVVGTATDVAKEIADLILLDNDFRTIVAAIEEGRIIFSNVRKVVAYMLSNSFAEVLAIFAAMVLGWPTPLLVGQILWIHLVCDGPADIVLGFEPKEEGIMEEPPRPLKEPILTRLGITLIAVISLSSAMFALYMFNHYYMMHQNAAEGRSIVFASLAMNSMIYIFAYRSLRLPLHRMNSLMSNPPLIWSVMAGILTVLVAFWIPGLRTALGLVVLSVSEWASVICFSMLLLLIVEIGKAIATRHDPKS